MTEDSKKKLKEIDYQIHKHKEYEDNIKQEYYLKKYQEYEQLFQQQQIFQKQIFQKPQTTLQMTILNSIFKTISELLNEVNTPQVMSLEKANIIKMLAETAEILSKVRS